MTHFMLKKKWTIRAVRSVLQNKELMHCMNYLNSKAIMVFLP